MRIVPVSGMSVRATSQPIGAATAQQIRPTETAMISVVSSGSTKLSSVSRVTKFSSVKRPSLSIRLRRDQPRHRQDDQDSEQRRSDRAEGAGRVDQGLMRGGSPPLPRARGCAGVAHDAPCHRVTAWRKVGEDRAAPHTLKILRVPRLDVVGLFLDLGGVLLQRLDVRQRRTSLLRLDAAMRRILRRSPRRCNCLPLARHAPGVQQPRRIRVGRGLGDRPIGLVISGVPSTA